MGRSKLYKAYDHYHLLTLHPAKASPVYNPATQQMEQQVAAGEAQHFEFRAQMLSQRDREALGLDANAMQYRCQLMKAPNGVSVSPLPPQLKEGFTFPMTIQGREGTASVLPIPDTRVPKARAVTGERFWVLWEYIS